MSETGKAQFSYMKIAFKHPTKPYLVDKMELRMKHNFTRSDLLYKKTFHFSSGEKLDGYVFFLM